MYKTTVYKVNVNLCLKGFVPCNIEEDRQYKGKPQFLFTWDVKNMEGLSEAITESREVEISREDFNRGADKYWELVRDKFPRDKDNGRRD